MKGHSTGEVLGTVITRKATSGRTPKRDAARSNRAGDANPPKTLRFRGITFPKTSPVEWPFIIPCNAYHRFYTDMKWGHARNYHICLDSGSLGIDKCVELIVQLF